MSDSDYSDDFDSGSDGDDYKSPTPTIKTKKTNKHLSARTSTTSIAAAYATARVGSANDKRMHKLKNKLAETKLELFEANKKLKLLTDLNRRQEKALDSYTGTEANLPKLIKQKDEEIRTAAARAKKLKTKHRELNETVKKLEKKERILTDKNRSLEALVRDKDLKGRAALKAELDAANKKISEKDVLIARLERMLELSNKERNRGARKASKPRASVPSPTPNMRAAKTVNRASKVKAVSPKPPSSWEAHGMPSGVASPTSPQQEPSIPDRDNRLMLLKEEAKRKEAEEQAARQRISEQRAEAERQAALAAAAEAEKQAVLAAEEAAKHAAEAKEEAERLAAEAEAEAERKAIADAAAKQKQAEQDKKKRELLAKLASIDNASSRAKTPVSALPLAQPKSSDDVSKNVADEVGEDIVEEVASPEPTSPAEDTLPWLSKPSQPKEASPTQPPQRKSPIASDPLPWLPNKNTKETTEPVVPVMKPSPTPTPTPSINPTEVTTSGSSAPSVGILPSIPASHDKVPTPSTPKATEEKPSFGFARDKQSLPSIGTPTGTPKASPRIGGRGRGLGRVGAGGGSLPGFHKPKRAKPKMLAHAAPASTSIVTVGDLDEVAI